MCVCVYINTHTQTRNNSGYCYVAGLSEFVFWTKLKMEKLGMSVSYKYILSVSSCDNTD